MQGKPAEIGALFAAVLVKALNADLMTFSDTAKLRQVDAGNSTLSLAESFRFAAGGTNFHSIFEGLGMLKCDRLIILSDMQAWMHSSGTRDRHGTSIPMVAHAEYNRRTGCDPSVWSFDLQGQGTLMFPERKVRALAGFSEKLLEVMSALENDPQALVKTVREYPLA